MHEEDLLPMLSNRVRVENQLAPQYIGKFNGVDALPKMDYPAIYCWVDTSIGGHHRLSFDKPLLEQWCIEEAKKRWDIVVRRDDEAIQRTIGRFIEASIHAFNSLLEKRFADSKKPRH